MTESDNLHLSCNVAAQFLYSCTTARIGSALNTELYNFNYTGIVLSAVKYGRLRPDQSALPSVQSRNTYSEAFCIHFADL